LVKALPLPWMSVLTSSLLPGFAFGMLTVGAVPNDPVAVTAEFAPTDDAEAEAEEEDFDEPQPARTTQASRGMAPSARKRRMKTSRVVDVSPASLLVRPSGCARHSGVPQLTPMGWLTHPKMAAPRLQAVSHQRCERSSTSAVQA
jgi:hypothetical protein